jgi:hypothetical protein
VTDWSIAAVKAAAGLLEKAVLRATLTVELIAETDTVAGMLKGLPPATASSSNSNSSIGSQRSCIANLLSASRALLRSGQAEQRLTIFYCTAKGGFSLKVFSVLTINNWLPTKGLLASIAQQLAAG